MGAYAKGENNQVIPISENRETVAATSSDQVTPNNFENLPLLPKIDHELSRYFSIARQLENALQHQKASFKKTKEELRQLQIRHSAFAIESENKIRNSSSREASLKARIEACQKSENTLREQGQKLSRQVEVLQSDQNLLKSSSEIYKQREETLKNSLRNCQVSEKEKTAQVNHLTQKLNAASATLQQYKAAWTQFAAIEKKAKTVIRALEKEKKNFLVELELLRGKLEHCEHREESLKISLKDAQADEQAQLVYIEKLKHELEEIKRELESHRASWKHAAMMEEKAKKISQESVELKQKLAEMEQTLQAGVKFQLERTDALNQESSELKKRLEETKSALQEEERSHHETREKLNGELEEMKVQLQAAEKAHQENTKKLKRELTELRSELMLYKTPVYQGAEVGRDHGDFGDSRVMKSKLEDLKEILSSEKNLKEDLEERIKKENREKQIALDCLNAAELKLSQVTGELDELRNKVSKNFDDSSSIRLGL